MGNGTGPQPASLFDAQPDPTDIDSGRLPAETIPQLVSALRQDFAGMGAALSTLELLLDQDDSPQRQMQLEEWLDRAAKHLRRADAKATLAIEKAHE